jgi:hypothetical protein
LPAPPAYRIRKCHLPLAIAIFITKIATSTENRTLSCARKKKTFTSYQLSLQNFASNNGTSSPANTTTKMPLATCQRHLHHQNCHFHRTSNTQLRQEKKNTFTSYQLSLQNFASNNGTSSPANTTTKMPLATCHRHLHHQNCHFHRKSNTQLRQEKHVISTLFAKLCE